MSATSSTVYTISSTQHAFVKAARPHIGNRPSYSYFSFSDLMEISNAAGYAAVPTWCMEPTRKYARGQYMVPELFATDEQFSIYEAKRGRKPGTTNTKVVRSRNTRAQFVPPVTNPMQTTTASDLVSGHETRMHGADMVRQAQDQLSTASLARTATNGESDSFVPSQDPNYVNWGHHAEIKDIIKRGLFAPVFITGLSGNGKTTMVEQICAQLKRECIRVNFTAQTDEDELIGGFRLINGETKFVPGPVLVAMERGTILLLDEIDLGGHLILCLQSILEGKGKFIPKIGKFVRPAPGFNILATANTKGKGDAEGRFIGTNIMNEAFLERFDFTYEQEYASNTVERKILGKYAESLEVSNDAFLDNLISWADIIRKSFKAGAVNEILTTRRLLHIVKAFSIFDDKMKSIERCITRFDDTTKEAFMQMYTKVDADVKAVDAAAPTDGVDAAASTNCPF